MALDRFREHRCLSLASRPVERVGCPNFAERARAFIKRGITPKNAVEMVLREVEFEFGKDARAMMKARMDAEEFLLKVRKGLI